MVYRRHVSDMGYETLVNELRLPEVILIQCDLLSIPSVALSHSFISAYLIFTRRFLLFGLSSAAPLSSCNIIFTKMPGDHEWDHLEAWVTDALRTPLHASYASILVPLGLLDCYTSKAA